MLGRVACVAALLLVACEAPAITLPEIIRRDTEVTLRVRTLGPAGPVAGARICASSPAGANERCAATDHRGEVDLRVRPGTFVVRGDPPDGTRLRALGTVALEVAAATAATVLFEARARIAGTVRDEGARAVAGAEVCANPADDGAPVCARAGADGAYAIEVRPGTYKLHVTGPPDGSRLIGQWARGRVESYEADSFDTRRGDVTGADVTLVRGRVLSGTVRAARDGAVVKEAQVCTQTLAAPLPWDCEQTDKRGRYAALREPGTYWVWFIPPDDAGRLLPQRHDRVDLGVDATPVTLDRDRVLDVALRDGPLLAGRVTTTDGVALAGALVCVDTPFPTGRICRPTDRDGRYSVATRPDTYTVQVIPPAESDAVGSYWDGKRDWTAAARVRIGADVALDIALPRGVRLSGTVRTEDGTPVEAAPVSLNDDRGFLAGTYTDRTGRYAVAVPPGSYTVDVFAPRVSQLVSRLGFPLTIDAELGLDIVLQFARP